MFDLRPSLSGNVSPLETGRGVLYMCSINILVRDRFVLFASPPFNSSASSASLIGRQGSSI